MPPPPDFHGSTRSIREVVDDLGVYPEEAFGFVQKGLNYTVSKIHGELPDDQADEPEVSRHVSGQDLCEGLRDFALEQWGLLARTVLARWNITSTLDFGRIVFALVDNGFMQKTDRDTLDDFRNVFDFRAAFDGAYRIVSK